MASAIESMDVRLLRLEEVASGVELLASFDSVAVRRSVRDQWAVERGLYLGTEIIRDIGRRILRLRFGISSESYEDIVIRLSSQGVIEQELSVRLRRFVRLLDLLVHDSLRLDPERVAEHLVKAPRDFSDFARAVRRWLEMAPSSLA